MLVKAGADAKWTERLRLLADIACDQAMLKMTHRCDPDAPCDGQGFEFGGHTWDVCPHDALQDPYFATAQWLADAQEVQPLSEWPGGWSMGMTFAVQAIRGARIRKWNRDNPPG